MAWNIATGQYEEPTTSISGILSRSREAAAQQLTAPETAFMSRSFTRLGLPRPSPVGTIGAPASPEEMVAFQTKAAATQGVVKPQPAVTPAPAPTPQPSLQPAPEWAYPDSQQRMIDYTQGVDANRNSPGNGIIQFKALGSEPDKFGRGRNADGTTYDNEAAFQGIKQRSDLAKKADYAASAYAKGMIGDGSGGYRLMTQGEQDAAGLTTPQQMQTRLMQQLADAEQTAAYGVSTGDDYGRRLAQSAAIKIEGLKSRLGLLDKQFATQALAGKYGAEAEATKAEAAQTKEMNPLKLEAAKEALASEKNMNPLRRAALEAQLKGAGLSAEMEQVKLDLYKKNPELVKGGKEAREDVETGLKVIEARYSDELKSINDQLKNTLTMKPEEIKALNAAKADMNRKKQQAIVELTKKK